MSTEIPVTFEDLAVDERYGPMILVKPTMTTLPARYKEFANAIYNFEYRSNDISLSSYPKSGTTWTAEIIWAMTHIDDLERAYTVNTNDRFHIIDNDFLHDLDVDVARAKLKSLRPDAKEEDGLALQLAPLDKEPRIVWCHLPFSLQNPTLLETCKVVYVIRHPKDNIFSRYNHFCKHFDMTLEEHLPPMVEDFMKGELLSGPYWYHVQEAWKQKDHPNLHILFYEDMKADIMSEIKKLNAFLKLNLTEQQLQKVVDHTSFSNMKAHPNMTPAIQGFEGSFLHKGKVGDSKGKLPPELEARMDAWIKDNARKVDPGFKYA